MVGPNGGGKTTLLETILGVSDYQHGHIERMPGIRVAYMPQKIALNQQLPMTVDRFLRLCRVPEDNKHVHMFGVHALLTQQLHTLSGGQWQRVLFATALAQPSDLLLLDEPAQGMDIEAQSVVYDCIEQKRAREHVAIILVSHDLNVVMDTTNRVLCVNTHICCSGDARDVRVHPAYRQLFGEQATLGVYQHHHDHQHWFSPDSREF